MTECPLPEIIMTSTHPKTVSKVLPSQSRVITLAALVASAAISTLVLGGVLGLFEMQSSQASASLARAAQPPASAASEAVASKTPRSRQG